MGNTGAQACFQICASRGSDLGLFPLDGVQIGDKYCQNSFIAVLKKTFLLSRN